LERLRTRTSRGGESLARTSRDVSQRSVEILIGRLVTDEAFRAMFIRDPAASLTQFTEAGHELTPLEISAIRSTHPSVWTAVAERIDPRLQKASLVFRK
jgi:hypothetical protein